jgi:hypothetical protein
MWIEWGVENGSPQSLHAHASSSPDRAHVMIAKTANADVLIAADNRARSSAKIIDGKS